MLCAAIKALMMRQIQYIELEYSPTARLTNKIFLCFALLLWRRLAFCLSLWVCHCEQWQDCPLLVHIFFYLFFLSRLLHTTIMCVCFHVCMRACIVCAHVCTICAEGHQELEPLSELDTRRWRQESEATGIINPSLVWVEQAITTSHVAVTSSEGDTHTHSHTRTHRAIRFFSTQ